MRTLVEIPGSDVAALDELGRRRRVSRSRLIREAVADYLGRQPRPTMAAAFGLWREKAIDGVAYQRALREEW
ncbi:MAG TPA: ribbon-helix-helix protein, CopG family [Caulobacteraceae bacterium]|nr:ribbon-helix-helix protein, CopG family [Caulobacteraceae bacterium]